MRITGGRFGGRTLAVPKTGDIRPTQDRVREALFSMLMNEIPGARFLDLFAGSGGVGLEALSRGAAEAVFVERNPKHLETLRRNASALIPADAPGAAGAREAAAPEARFVKADAYRWIASYSGEGFDIAFADPPYALGEERGYVSVLETLAARGVVRPGGMFVAEMTAHQQTGSVPGWSLVRERDYGKSRLCLWRRDGADAGATTSSSTGQAAS